MTETKMRVFNLAKELGIKAPDFLKILKDQGFGYKSINSNIVDDPEDIKEAVRVHVEEAKEKSELLDKYSNGVFLGVVYNTEAQKYNRVLMKIDMAEFKKIHVDFQELGEHGSIFGVKLELAKDMQRNLITDPKDFEEK